jgi:hypothetical protein
MENKSLNQSTQGSFDYNSYIPYNIMTFTVISTLLWLYALFALILGLQPFKRSNPISIYNVIDNPSMMNILMAIFTLIVSIGVSIFLYLSITNIIQQRVVYDS